MTTTTTNELQPISASAPASLHASRNASRTSSPRGSRVASRPGSAPASPTRAIKKHTYGATFGKAPKQVKDERTLCPVHSYSELIAFQPRGGAVSFGAPPRRRAKSLDDQPQPHAYMSPRSTLSKSTSGKFSTAPLKRASTPEPSGPAVHSYAAYDTFSTLSKSTSGKFSTAPLKRASTPEPSGPEVHSYAAYDTFSTLSKKGGSWGRAPPRERPVKEGDAASVHSYQGMGTFLSLKGGTMAKSGRKDETRSLCPSHSYGELRSSLKTSGAAAFNKSGASLPPLKKAVLPPIGKTIEARPASPTGVENQLDAPALEAC